MGEPVAGAWLLKRLKISVFDTERFELKQFSIGSGKRSIRQALYDLAKQDITCVRVVVTVSGSKVRFAPLDRRLNLLRSCPTMCRVMEDGLVIIGILSIIM